MIISDKRNNRTRKTWRELNPGDVFSAPNTDLALYLKTVDGAVSLTDKGTL